MLEGVVSSVGVQYDADHQRVKEIFASGSIVRTMPKLHPDHAAGPAGAGWAWSNEAEPNDKGYLVH